MKSKIRYIAIGLVLVIGTFIGTNLLSIPLGNKVLLPYNDYKVLAETYEKYGELDALEYIINRDYIGEIDNEKMIEGAKKGLFAALKDPYSGYMDKDEYDDLKEIMEGRFVGVGVSVTANDDDFIEIGTVVKNSPAQKTDLRPGDIIFKVEDIEYTGLEIEKAIEQIKGVEGTKVRLSIFRETDGNKEILEKELIREPIQSESVRSKMLEGNMGYMSLEGFDDTSYDDFKSHYKDLEMQGMKGFILDVRGNPGGDLTVCTDITDELVGKGAIVKIADKKEKMETISSDENKIEIPFVVIIDEYSASASEILAAAVKDHKTGTLVGKTTYGKGLVQVVRELKSGAGYKLTVSEYFSPNTGKINKKGVAPDVEVEVELSKETKVIGIDAIEENKISEDAQLSKSMEIINQELGI